MTTRTALVAGATGLVGGHCVDLLLDHPDYARVVVLTRRGLSREHSRLEVREVDFDALPAGTEGLSIDDVFLCLGTTIKKAGSQEAFRRVDHGYTIAVARLAHERGARRAALVSAVGADLAAWSSYLRVKGETERDVAAVGFDTLAVMRPGLLLGDRTETRVGERVGIAVARAVGPALFGGLRDYRAIDAREVAAAMIAAVARGATAGTQVHAYVAMRTLAAPPG
jgi:uncharacterized protein YbjT (DUF2867 family)